MQVMQKLIYINKTDFPLRIWLEPWAHQYLIDAGQKIDVHIYGEKDKGVVEFEYSSEGLVIYGFEGSIIQLFLDGKELQQVRQI